MPCYLNTKSDWGALALCPAGMDGDVRATLCHLAKIQKDNSNAGNSPGPESGLRNRSPHCRPWLRMKMPRARD